MHDLAKDVRRIKTLTDAWRAIQQNGRLSKSPETRNEIAAFAEDAPRKLNRIQLQLRRDKFVFLPSKGIKKKKPKGGFRPLVLAPLENRIVQRAVHDVLLQVDQVVKLVKTPWSFGGIRKDKDDEYSSVPAAVKAVLDAIGAGGRYIVRSDITAFFTQIPKSKVRNTLDVIIPDKAFLALFDRAIAAELSNLVELGADAAAFPIEDLVVAQGNSLSPLMGNILLKDFDQELNSLTGITCIRFIDDFIILGPNKEETTKAFDLAKLRLAALGMSLSTSKTDWGSSQKPFEFLSIEFNNGFIRPTRAKQQDFLESIAAVIEKSDRALFELKRGSPLRPNETVIRTLKTISDISKGWAMSYRFCNDPICFRNLDKKISDYALKYIQTYRSVQKVLGDSSTWELLGIQSLEKLEKKPFAWPKLSP